MVYCHESTMYAIWESVINLTPLASHHLTRQVVLCLNLGARRHYPPEELPADGALRKLLDAVLTKSQSPSPRGVLTTR